MSGLRELLDAACPGPWHTTDWQSDGRSLAIEGGDGEDWIAVAFAADARLIALAPELAALCLDMGELLGWWAADGSVHEPGCLINRETMDGCDCLTATATELLDRLDRTGGQA